MPIKLSNIYLISTTLINTKTREKCKLSYKNEYSDILY